MSWRAFAGIAARLLLDEPHARRDDGARVVARPRSDRDEAARQLAAPARLARSLALHAARLFGRHTPAFAPGSCRRSSAAFRRRYPDFQQQLAADTRPRHVLCLWSIFTASNEQRSAGTARPNNSPQSPREFTQQALIARRQLASRTPLSPSQLATIRAPSNAPDQILETSAARRPATRNDANRTGRLARRRARFSRRPQPAGIRAVQCGPRSSFSTPNVSPPMADRRHVERSERATATRLAEASCRKRAASLL